MKNWYHLASLTILEKWVAGFSRRNLRLPRPTVVCLLHTTRPSLQWFVKASMNASTVSKGLLRTGSDTDVAGTGSANTAKCITIQWSQYYTHTLHTYTL